MPNETLNIAVQEPPLNSIGKFTAGGLLILFTLLAIAAIVLIWPDRMPDSAKKDLSWYKKEGWGYKLIDSAEYNAIKKQQDKCNECKNIKNAVADDTSKPRKVQEAKTSNAKTDSPKVKPAPDSTKPKQIGDSAKMKFVADSLKSIAKTIQNNQATNNNTGKECCNCTRLLHLNSILLLLVALMGFLGNMIHISTSFTTFVGNNTFTRSWLLWYFVKPFTAAGLAIILYFVIRGGFLSYSADGANFNIYGILTFAALAGLFADTATLKLKEVFEVIFKPKDERGDKLNDNNKIIFTSIKPTSITANTETEIEITGKNFNSKTLTVKANDKVIASIEKTDTSIKFKYLKTDQDTLTEVTIEVYDADKKLYKIKLKIT